jgi:hypothetical protein
MTNLTESGDGQTTFDELCEPINAFLGRPLTFLQKPHLTPRPLPA